MLYQIETAIACEPQGVSTMDATNDLLERGRGYGLVGGSGDELSMTFLWDVHASDVDMAIDVAGVMFKSYQVLALKVRPLFDVHEEYWGDEPISIRKAARISGIDRKTLISLVEHYRVAEVLGAKRRSIPLYAVITASFEYGCGPLGKYR